MAIFYWDVQCPAIVPLREPREKITRAIAEESMGFKRKPALRSEIFVVWPGQFFSYIQEAILALGIPSRFVGQAPSSPSVKLRQ